MTDFQYQTIPAPVRGMNTEAAPDSVPQDQCIHMHNLVVTADGRVQVRARHKTSIMPTYTDSWPISAWTSTRRILVGRRDKQTATGNDRVTPQESALYPVNSGPEFVTGRVEASVLDMQTRFGTTELTLGSVALIPGIKSARVQNYVYGNAFDATGGLLTDVTYQVGEKLIRRTPFLRWDGSTGPPVQIIGPRGGLDIKTHLQRLFVLGGVRADNTLSSPTPSTAVLYFSDPLPQTGAFASDTADNWKDNVSGLFNFVDIGSDDALDPGVGLALLGRTLLIFKRYSIWALYGDEPENFTVRKVVTGVGCVDARSIVEHNDSVFFASDTGIYRFDGVQLQEISANIRSDIRNHMQNAAIVNFTAPYGRSVSMGMIDSTHLFLNMATNNANHVFSAYYNLARDSWCQFSSNAYGSTPLLNHPFVLANSISGVWGINNGNYGQLSDIFNPRDTIAGQTVTGSVGHDIRDYIVGITAHIKVSMTAGFTSRSIRLGSPIFRSKLHRVMTDYRFREDSHDSWTNDHLVDWSGVFFFKILEGNNTANELHRSTLEPTHTTIDGANALNQLRQRLVSDEFSEANDIQYKVEFLGTYAPPPGEGGGATQYISAEAIEFQTALIEYATAGQRRTS